MKFITGIALCAFTLSAVTATATWKRPTKEGVQSDVDEILQRCGAAKLLSVTVDDELTIRIVALKNPYSRTAEDLRALRCVARQRTPWVDFRPLEQALLASAAWNPEAR